jgi:hypothetical protein
MMENEIASLATLLDRIKQVLASPMCLSSTPLTALDELQISLNASRLDATYEEDQNTVEISSALARERRSDTGLQWETLLKGHDTDADWLVERLSAHDSYENELRTSLRWVSTGDQADLQPDGSHSVSIRITITWDNLAPNTQEPCTTKWKSLVVWIKLADSRSSRLFWRRAIEGIRTIPESCRTLTERVKFSFAERDLGGSTDIRNDGFRKFLSTAFDRFDERLKWLLLNHGELRREALETKFLAQFFWVDRVGRKQGDTDLAKVRAIFLPYQRQVLVETATELARPTGRPCEFEIPLANPIGKQFPVPGDAKHKTDAAESAVQLLENFDLDSRSLFSAFPADTSLSVYVEHWPSEEITKANLLKDPKEQDLRQLFYTLTSMAQRKESKSITSGVADNDKVTTGSGSLTLFSVPVVVRDIPLFVVQINSPKPLDSGVREVLASAIRTLGGEIKLHIRTFDYEALDDFDRRHVNSLSLDQFFFLANDLTSGIPLAAKPLKSALKGASDYCSIAKEHVRHLDTVIEQHKNRLEGIKQRLPAYKRETFLIIEGIIAAIRSIPELEYRSDKVERRRKLKIDLDQLREGASDCYVTFERETFQMIVQDIVTKATARCTMDGELSISAKRENPDASIRQLRIAFKDTGPPIPQGVDLEVLWKDFSKDSHLGNVMYARENVRRMGGELLIDETVQTGTQIEMVLPLVDVDGRRL